jgi:hypothetical protein
VFAALTLLSAPLGIWLRRSRLRGALVRAGQDEALIRKAHFEALLLGTSIPQLPALFSTFLFMFGSEILPVGAAIAISVAAVLVHALIS